MALYRASSQRPHFNIPYSLRRIGYALSDTWQGRLAITAGAIVGVAALFTTAAGFQSTLSAEPRHVANANVFMMPWRTTVMPANPGANTITCDDATTTPDQHLAVCASMLVSYLREQPTAAYRYKDVLNEIQALTTEFQTGILKPETYHRELAAYARPLAEDSSRIYNRDISDVLWEFADLTRARVDGQADARWETRHFRME